MPITAGNTAVNMMARGVNIGSLGCSVGEWLTRLGCGACTYIFVAHGLHTISQIFSAGLSDIKLREFDTVIMTMRQRKVIEYATDTVEAIFAVITSLVDKIVDRPVHPQVGVYSPPGSSAALKWQRIPDPQMASINDEDNIGFYATRQQKGIQAVIDRTVQQGLTHITQSIPQLGLPSAYSLLEHAPIVAKVTSPHEPSANVIPQPLEGRCMHS